MDPRKRVIARCANASPSGDKVAVDLSDFVLRLILFEKVILHSVQLREFPAFVRAFGYGPVRELLASDAMDVYYDLLLVGSVGNALQHRLPLGSYQFATVHNADRRALVSRGLQHLHSLEHLNTKQVIQLKRDLVYRLSEPLGQQGAEAISVGLMEDLRSNGRHLKTAVAIALKEKLNADVGITDFSMTIHPLDEKILRVETDISRLFGLSDEDTHKVVERGLLAVGGLNERFAEMHAFSAISGFKSAELPIFQDKLGVLSQKVFPEAEAQLDRMKRVLAIRGFEDLDSLIAQGKVDLNKLLELRETRECQDFRDWLWSIGSATDAEIEERVNSLRDKLSWAARGEGGRTLRWIASTGIGLGAGDVSGTIGGLLDTFIVERILPVPGPWTFISSLYPSIFVDKDPSTWSSGFLGP